MEAFVDYVLSRLGEASTWRGIIVAISGITGMQLPPEQAAAVIAAGMALAGLIGVFIPDRVKK